MIERLARRLELEPHELRHALTLALVLFGITSSYTLVKTARDSLYLSRLPAQSLPYVYLGVGGLTLLVSQVVAKLTRRVPTWVTLVAAAAIASVSLAAFAPFFRSERGWLPVAFYLWVNVYGLILVSQFWAFTNSISDPRLAKRIFGMIGGGGILGGLIGGLTASALGPALGLDALAFSAALLVALVVPLIVTGVRRGHTPAEAVAARPERTQSPWSSSYVRWLAIASLCSVIITGVLDYQLKVEIQNRYPTRTALAQFFGMFYTAMNLGALAVQMIVTRWSLSTLGASSSSLVLPAGLGIGAVATLLAPGALTVLGTRLWDQIIRLSLNKAAVELFYFPLEPALRRHAKAVIEAGLERVGDGIAGLMILGIGIAFGVDTWTIAVLIVVVVAIWLVAWYELRRGYERELSRTLNRLHVDPEQMTIRLRERRLLKEMVRLLDSPYERVVMHGMDLLEDSAMPLLEKRLPRLVEHASARVRGRALELIATFQTDSAREQVRALLNDEDPAVRLGALRATCALGRGRPTRTLDPFFDDQDPRLRATALQCLVQFAPAEEDARVHDILEPRLRDGATARRIEAVEALAVAPTQSRLHDLLTPLLADPDLEVRNAALRAAASGKRREHIPMLIEALGKSETERAARAGLAAMGEIVVGTLADLLVDTGVRIEVRREIPRVLREIPTSESILALFRFRDRSDMVLTYRVLKACNRIRRANPEIAFPSEQVREDLEYEVRTYWLGFLQRRAFTSVEGGSAETFLSAVLDERLAQTLNRVFRRLALIYPPDTIYAAYRGRGSGKPHLRGNALEYLETALSAEDRELVLPLLDDTPDEEQLPRAQERFGLREPSYAEALQECLNGTDSWLRVCALYVVGYRRERALAELVQVNLQAEDPRVRETAAWAQNALAAG
ncbi:MAG TPA: HEAT repeat domain-containing protein [Candidatus Limnocylindria bacterium]|nr:HEAT repeat domain-containing protein [Candidatus Limnocylindria bacterium]